MKEYQPPFTLNQKILSLVANITQTVGSLSVQLKQEQILRLRKTNRIRSIHGSLAIEGNTLSESQITAILDGKRVLAPIKEVKEAQNAIEVYDQLEQWSASNEKDLLKAHEILMSGLILDAGRFRVGGVGVMSGSKVVHMAPQADRVSKLMNDLLNWLATTEFHPLIVSCIFHYEFEFIHPFDDGNGRMGRLWQTLILSQWNQVFSYLPVESLVYESQTKYYQALRDSTKEGECSSFVEFMLEIISNAINSLEKGGRTYTTPKTTHITTQKQAEILSYLRTNPRATRKKLSQDLEDISEDGVKYNLKVLQEKGLLRRVGSNRAGYWQVL